MKTKSDNQSAPEEPNSEGPERSHAMGLSSSELDLLVERVSLKAASMVLNALLKVQREQDLESRAFQYLLINRYAGGPETAVQEARRITKLIKETIEDESTEVEERKPRLEHAHFKGATISIPLSLHVETIVADDLLPSAVERINKNLKTIQQQRFGQWEKTIQKAKEQLKSQKAIEMEKLPMPPPIFPMDLFLAMAVITNEPSKIKNKNRLIKALSHPKVTNEGEGATQSRPEELFERWHDLGMGTGLYKENLVELARVIYGAELPKRKRSRKRGKEGQHHAPSRKEDGTFAKS